MRMVARNGGQGRNRTADAGLFRAALYQLSYLATSRELRMASKSGELACEHFECVRNHDYSKREQAAQPALRLAGDLHTPGPSPFC